ncbi:MAG: phosphatase PAP2 family protein [Candidatus Lokiarchaeota archaeon]|nr:phosphatase PAP2 family protein [Candidatus Lokiarchaeota archaeon]
MLMTGESTMFFDPEFTVVLRELMPWAGLFFRAITELGSELFYVALLLTSFWAFKKRESITVIFVLLFSIVSNYWLKTAIANPRPPETYHYPGVDPTNYSTPSGHSQNSATLFGWISAKVKIWWVFLVSIILTLLIGISRIYLGVHFLGDVLLGWLIGFLIVILLLYLQEPLNNFVAEQNYVHLYILLFVFGLAATVFSTYILPLPPGDNFGALGGLIMGIAIGLPLERRYVDFSVEAPEGQKWRLALRVIFGLILVLVIMVGLGSILPTTEVWLRALRYALATVTGLFIWPVIFTRIGL